MDRNRAEGTKHEVKGAVKEVVGEVAGNQLREVAGNLQERIGKAADDARAVRHEREKRRH